MFPNNQDPPSQQPGKIVTGVDKYQSQSGQVVELRRIELTVLENNLLRKENCSEVEPPLADSRIPESVADIRECRVCLKLFHKDNVSTCPVCGGDYDLDCREEIKAEDGIPISTCALCAKEANTGLARRMCKRFWQIGD